MPIAQINKPTLQEILIRGQYSISSFAEDMLGAPPHEGQKIWWDSPDKPHAHTRVMAAGNRWGKTYSQAVKLLHHALYQPRDDRYVIDALGNFNEYRVANIAMSLDQAMLSWGYCSALAAKSPIYKNFIVKESGAPFPCITVSLSKSRSDKNRIHSEIWARSTARKARFLLGKSFSYLSYDEAAFDVDGEYITEQVLRMRLADTGGQIDFVSSPNGRNWFYRLFEQGQNPNIKSVWSRNAPTWENPYVNHEYIRDVRSTMSQEWVMQNIEGQFADFSSWFSVTDIIECTRDQDYSLPVPYGYDVIFRDIVDKSGEQSVESKFVKIQGKPRYVMGVDLANKGDKTVIVVILLGEDGAKDRIVYCWGDTKKPWKYMYDKITEVSRSYGGCHVLVDSTGLGGGVILEALQEAPYSLNVTGYNMAGTVQEKLDILLIGQSVIQRRAIQFPYLKPLVDQLTFYQTSDKNMQTDYVFAFCLAVFAASLERKEINNILFDTDTEIYVPLRMKKRLSSEEIRGIDLASSLY